MTTFESDHGDPGGPWNLSKKLRFLDLLMFRGRLGVFDPLNMVWGVWNQARNFGNSILIIFLFLMSLETLCVQLAWNTDSLLELYLGVMYSKGVWTSDSEA